MTLTSPLAIVLDTSPLGLSGRVVATANAGHLSVLTTAFLRSDIGF